MARAGRKAGGGEREGKGGATAVAALLADPDCAAPGKAARLPHHNPDRVPPSFLLAIGLNQFYMSSVILVPRTLSVFMVRRFLGGGPGGDAGEARVAAATGALSSTFSLVQLAVSFFWGWVSDITGRLPILLLSNVASGLLTAGFTLSTSYRFALAARAVGGAFMCSGVVIKASIGDECTKAGQARAMAARALGLGVAQLITPLAVGALADPCSLYDSGGPGFGKRGTPACGPGALLYEQPYVMVAGFIGAVAVIATASNWFFIPTGVEMRADRVAARRVARARLGAGLVRGLTCGRVRLAVPPMLSPATSSPKADRHLARVVEEAEEEEEVAPPAGPPHPPPPPRPRLAVVSPFAAASAEAAPLPPPSPPGRPRAGVSEGTELGGRASGTAAGPPPARPPLRGTATAPATVGGGSAADADHSSQGSGPPQPGGAASSVPTAGAAHPPPPTPGSLASTPSSRLRSALARAATAAAGTASRLGRSLTSSPSLARARASTLAAFTAAAVAMADRGGAADAPGGGELGDLNDAADAAARYRLARAATSIAVPVPPLPPSPPSASATTAAPADPEAAATSPPPPPKWYRHRPALLSIAAYGISAVVFCVVDELLPLYASAPTSASGLAQNTQQLGWALAASGVFLILTSAFVYPPLQDALGLSGVLGWGLVAGFFMCVPAYPLAHRVAIAALAAAWSARGVAIAVQAVLWVAGLLYAISYNMTNTSTQVLVNLTAPPGAVGSVNGAGNALSALGRVVAPILAAAMWGAAASLGSRFEQWLPYSVAGLVFLVGRVLMAVLRVTDARMLGEV